MVANLLIAGTETAMSPLTREQRELAAELANPFAALLAGLQMPLPEMMAPTEELEPADLVLPITPGTGAEPLLPVLLRPTALEAAGGTSNTQPAVKAEREEQAPQMALPTVMATALALPEESRPEPTLPDILMPTRGASRFSASPLRAVFKAPTRPQLLEPQSNEQTFPTQVRGGQVAMEISVDMPLRGRSVLTRMPQLVPITAALSQGQVPLSATEATTPETQQPVTGSLPHPMPLRADQALVGMNHVPVQAGVVSDLLRVSAPQGATGTEPLLTSAQVSASIAIAGSAVGAAAPDATPLRTRRANLTTEAAGRSDSLPLGNIERVGTQLAPSSVPETASAGEPVAIRSFTRPETRHEVTHLQLELAPPLLGQVSVEIRHEGSQVLARALVDQPATAEALRQVETQVRQVLADQGLQLGQFDISHGESGYRQPEQQSQMPDPPPPSPVPVSFPVPEIRQDTVSHTEGSIDFYA